MILIKLLCNIIALWHVCSPVNLLHIFRTPFYKNIYGGLLLNRCLLKMYLSYLVDIVVKQVGTLTSLLISLSVVCTLGNIYLICLISSLFSSHLDNLILFISRLLFSAYIVISCLTFYVFLKFQYEK